MAIFQFRIKILKTLFLYSKTKRYLFNPKVVSFRYWIRRSFIKLIGVLNYNTKHMTVIKKSAKVLFHNLIPEDILYQVWNCIIFLFSLILWNKKLLLKWYVWNINCQRSIGAFFLTLDGVKSHSFSGFVEKTRCINLMCF